MHTQTELGVIMRTELFMYFCIKKYIGTQGEVRRQLKIVLDTRWFMLPFSGGGPGVVFILCGFVVRGLYYGALHVLKSSCALCLRVFSFILALWSLRSGKRELVCVLLVHLFVCFIRVSFCPFSLPLCVGGWLWFVIGALPGLFY